MESISENVFGTRLKLARKMAGFSLQELADALENRVSKQSLNKYEQGLMKPSSDILLAISKTLKVKPDYFLKRYSVEFGEILFRKKESLSKKTEEAIIERVRECLERYIEIENIMDVKSEFINPLKDLTISTKEDIVFAAKKLRESWDLGSDSIPSLILILELKGVKVILIDDVEEIDGLAVFTSKNIPVVVVNTKNKSIERIRFTIIHELAHLLLTLSDTISLNPKEVEKSCHLFSSCFLLPQNSLLQMMGGKRRKYIRIEELISIKESFGISIRAILYSLKYLGIIDETYYQKWIVYLSKTYGSINEPGNYKGDEKAKHFNQLVNRALAEDIISISKAATLWNINVNEIRNGFGSI